MGVTAYVGLWGSGKTLALVEECQQAFEDGFEVYSNFGFRNGSTVETLGEVLSLCAAPVLREDGSRRRIFLALDEVGMLFPARGWSQFPPALNVLWQQGRKLGISVGYTTQDIELVDSNVRRVTGTIVKCTGYFPKRISEKGVRPVEKRPRLFKRQMYLQKPNSVVEPYMVTWHRFKPEIADLYDTYFLVSAAQRVLEDQADRIERGLVPVFAGLPELD